MHVQIVLFDGFDLMDAIAPYEVFAAAAMYSGGALAVELVSAEGKRSVPSGMNGPRLEAEGVLDPGRAGVIVVPGASGTPAGASEDSVPYLLAQAMKTELTDLLKQAMGNDQVTLATVCGGSLLLAMSGLLEDRHAVTNHLGMDALGATGAIPVQARVVEDTPRLVSGGGVTSGFEVAFYLVERELGPQIAHAVEKLFEYERRGTVWRPEGRKPLDFGDAEDAEEAEDARAPEVVPAVQKNSEASASSIEGMWRASISTPIGKMEVMLHIFRENGFLRGQAKQGDEAAEFLDPVWDGTTLSWSQKVRKPMRLNLKFEISVQGDAISGTAKAGLLPASKVEGRRLA